MDHLGLQYGNFHNDAMKRITLNNMIFEVKYISQYEQFDINIYNSSTGSHIAGFVFETSSVSYWVNGGYRWRLQA